MSVLQCLRDNLDLPLSPVKMGINHPTASMARHAFDDDEKWDKYFKFCVIRNPWAWWVSIWRRHNATHNSNFGFEEFVVRPPLVQADNIHSLCPSDWADLPLVYKYRLEDWARDGVAVPGLPRYKIEHMSAGEHEHYTEYHTDATVEIISRRSLRMIREFGYRYG
jgi:hypothetical protein